MNDNTTIRVGILGTSAIAGMALIDPAAKNEDVQVAAVASRDRQRGETYAAKHHIARAHDNYDALIQDDQIDAVYLPLPNHLHAEWTFRALDAGKHVLCEKPLAMNADEAQQIAERSQQTGLIVFEGVHFRHHPLAARIKEIVDSGTLGKLQHVEAHLSILLFGRKGFRFAHESGGGATMDLGCYAVNILRFLVSEEPTVLGARASLFHDQVDRSMEAQFRFPSGCTGTMKCSLFSMSLFQCRVVVHGEEGRMIVSNPFMPHAFPHRIKVVSKQGKFREKVPGDATFDYQLRAFVDSIRGDAAAVTDAADAVRNANVIDAIYEAAGLKKRGAFVDSS